MKDFCIVELDKFLVVADNIEHPFKFFEIRLGDETIRAEIWMRTALISWEGESGTDRIKQLKEHGFSEARLKETKKVMLEDLM